MREMLLSLPLSYAMAAVFLTACVLGGLCVLLCVAVTSIPDAIRDVRGSRDVRKAAIK